MADPRRHRSERSPTHPMVEGLRGVLVLVLTTAGVAAIGYLTAAAFAAVIS